MNRKTSETRSTPATRWRTGWQAVRRTFFTLDRPPVYFLTAAILTFAVEALSRRSVLAAATFLLERPFAYLANYGIILLTLLLGLLFRRRVAGATFMTAIWTVLGIAQCIVLCSRVTPLTAADIAVALSVISIISAYFTPLQFLLLCLALIGVIVGIIVLFIKAGKRSVRLKPFLTVYIPSLLLTVVVIAVGFWTGQLSDHFPNLATAYNDYGFPYCFGMSVVDKGVDRPDEYGEELITGILQELPSVSPPAEEGVVKPNVIFVQLESFFDVSYMQGVTFSSHPTPGFVALKERYPSGILHVPVIGAGTVNTEFEVLTGMNVADFGAGEYPLRTIMRDKTCETIAYDLLADGYRTHALHNHQGSFYLRNEVYPNLGFESFTSIEYFEEPTFNANGWAHDALLTDEILYLLTSTPEPDFVFAVSVQGHGKYPDVYEPASDDVRVTGGIENEAVRSHFNYYINQLREMDAFVTALYEAVMQMEEETVLVFYGDHLPSIVRDEGITLSTGDFETEYIIVSNYTTPSTPAGGELHAYHIFPTVLETIGCDIGVMNQFHRTYREDERYSELLEALEYDVLYGRRMAYGETEYQPLDMIMGSRPIRITGVTLDNEYLVLTGDNFTAYSMVAVDGKTYETQWINRNTLRVRLGTDAEDATETLSKAEEVTVRQYSDTTELLSESEPYRLVPVEARSPRIALP